MNKLIGTILSLALLIWLSGCNLITTQTTTETTTTTTSTTTTTTTTDWRLVDIDGFFAVLAGEIPAAFSADLVLPLSDNPGYEVVYLADDVELTDGILVYQPVAYDSLIPVTARITYEGLTRDYDFTLTQIHDEALYNEAETQAVLDSVSEEIENAFPASIGSDLTLPESNVPGVTITYDVDRSYIFHDRFIFTFPSVDETVNFTATITYCETTRTLSIPVVMEAFSKLAKIPELYINTEGGAAITSDIDYVNASLSLVTFDEDLNATIAIDHALLGIRLRGNSTLFMPKKPYKLKFAVKTALLSDYAQKDWVLLANFADQTLVRNYLAHTMAKDIGMEFAPAAKFVDVYLNGVYQGNYMLTDQVEVSNHRVDVEEGSANLDTGYLVEFDRRIGDPNLPPTDENYFVLYGIPFALKSPKEDDPNYSEAQKFFIEDYINTVYLTLQNQEDYSALIDEASWIDWFIVEEVFKNVDSGYSSVFMYKDTGGKLKMGPVWDFDLSTGNPGHLEAALRGPEGWYTARPDKNIFYYYLMEYPVFREHLKARWNEVYETVVLQTVNNIYPTVDSIAKSRYLNFQLWDVIGKNQDWYTAPEILALTTYEEQVWFLYDYLTTRIAWLDREINLL